MIGFRVFLLPRPAILRFRLLLCDLIISALGLALRPASRKSSINIYGGQGGTRTHTLSHLILSQTSLPIPSLGHIAVFDPSSAKLSFKTHSEGVHFPLRQHHRGTTSFRLNRRLETRVSVSVPRRTGSCIRSRLAG